MTLFHDTWQAMQAWCETCFLFAVYSGVFMLPRAGVVGRVAVIGSSMLSYCTIGEIPVIIYRYLSSPKTKTSHQKL